MSRQVEPNSAIVGVLLAAGKSSRYGGQKLLDVLPSNGLTMLECAARKLLHCLPNSVAVIRPNANEVKNCLLQVGMPWVENRHADRGISSSIRCGMSTYRFTRQEVSGWMFALADMPYISISTMKSVVAALENGATIAAPFYLGQRGHPVGFSRLLERELYGLSGDNGAKSILKKNQTLLQRVPVEDEYVLYDVDCPNQLI